MEIMSSICGSRGNGQWWKVQDKYTAQCELGERTQRVCSGIVERRDKSFS